jgi:hypothetical protein
LLAFKVSFVAFDPPIIAHFASYCKRYFDP